MVPHVTTDFERPRSSSSAHPTPKTFKFPDFNEDERDDDTFEDISRGPSPKPLPNGLPPGLHSSERWPLRKEAKGASWGAWANGATGGTRHSRQKSLSEAIRTVRGRKASISENAHEIAESLKAPVSYKLVILCGIWFTASILSNTSSKAILTALPKPVTLTVMQFLQVTLWCFFSAWLAKRNATVRNNIPVLKNGIRRPSKDIIMVTLPLTAFQIGGHILNSDAMSRIPVSLVHTIKGLSPLMTVIAYRVFLDTKYSIPTYLSLIPLTLGVVMACSASFRGNILGLTYAFGSAILFVTQNIVSKTLFNEAAKAEADGMPVGRRKPDKLNLLCYSSALAFLVTVPIWVWSEGLSMAADYWQDGSIDLRDRPDALDHGRLTLEFLFNGTFHFGQSLVAFVLLGMVSPVTYSVASLIKRVAVIIFAIVWFGNPMTKVQGMGFVLTFLGLYLYDRTSDAAKADKRAREKAETAAPLLPLNMADAKKSEASGFTQSPMTAEDIGRPSAGGSSHVNGGPVGSGPGRPHTPHANGVPISFVPGTKAEETWNPGDTGKPAVR
ncbi:hypothetical protein LTR37_019549 [Vermiconidia calcicola]|uniref:Uncharacterized protein n=1 Tax=Vermiconidia calcicola TaxID=1690605 RepID=A0ACC3MFN2_9PEZI|nr:hypothetical protein LTR37_019549 [Vermiconidia calcicola]